MISKKTLIPIVAAAVVGAGSLGAIAATSDNEPVRLPQAGEATIENVSDDAVASFGIFAEARTAEDALPAQVFEKVKGTIPYGANPSLSKRIAWSGDTAVYAAPGRGFICTILPTAEGAITGCQPAAAIERGNGTGPSVNSSETTDQIFAVVPDGVREVTLTHESGKTTAVPVQDGGYYTEVSTSDPGRTISYDGPDGPVEQNVPVVPLIPGENSK